MTAAVFESLNYVDQWHYAKERADDKEAFPSLNYSNTAEVGEGTISTDENNAVFTYFASIVLLTEGTDRTSIATAWRDGQAQMLRLLPEASSQGKTDAIQSWNDSLGELQRTLDARFGEEIAPRLDPMEEPKPKPVEPAPAPAPGPVVPPVSPTPLPSEQALIAATAKLMALATIIVKVSEHFTVLQLDDIEAPELEQALESVETLDEITDPDPKKKLSLRMEVLQKQIAIIDAELAVLVDRMEDPDEGFSVDAIAAIEASLDIMEKV